MCNKRVHDLLSRSSMKVAWVRHDILFMNSEKKKNKNDRCSCVMKDHFNDVSLISVKIIQLLVVYISYIWDEYL